MQYKLNNEIRFFLKEQIAFYTNYEREGTNFVKIYHQPIKHFQILICTQLFNIINRSFRP